MKRALLVKVSSMGDLTHALPAITDAKKALPELVFDWVVDEAFQEVPMLHPAVDRVIPFAHRRWKKTPWTSKGEVFNRIGLMRQIKYDTIIDGQTSFKAAIITALAKGRKCGPDWHSSREKGVQFAYHDCFTVPKYQHAIDRLRQLFAYSLNYPLPDTPPDYGIDLDRLIAPSFDLPKAYRVFILHGSWASKTYPEQYCHELIQLSRDCPILLPWGNESEHLRSKRLAEPYSHVHVLPRLSLRELCMVLKSAQGAISMDTGPAHLTAMLGTPQVTLYGPTDPALIGTIGKNQVHLTTPLDCSMCYKMECSHPSKVKMDPACFAGLTPQMALHALQSLQSFA
ncbi:MAG: Lipopolysaccharide heptosyltransferase 1 [Chlamydiia bacterium]|nr:Lipopolysaccharide heptosyltransferase 1 [Chlamydiia bacterium]MCH9615829.1 Lipopolysaccharide heptosyltransferase 1 [Chlamydiia bacterium]MCH9628768.1 Lipopolysaccharide heptosyltransferase 1 [Chlamydiia bacterium]